MSVRAVALLRGVNVGKGKRVPMAELSELLESLGHTDVKTLLNSGNAVFTARRGSPAALAKAIAGALESRFGFEVPVIVKTAAELDAMAQENALAATASDPSRLLTVFAQDPAALAAVAAMKPLLARGEALNVGALAAYLHCGNGILESALAKALLGREGRALTTRNWATVEKLRALLSTAGPGPAARN